MLSWCPETETQVAREMNPDVSTNVTHFIFVCIKCPSFKLESTSSILNLKSPSFYLLSGPKMSTRVKTQSSPTKLVLHMNWGHTLDRYTWNLVLSCG